MKKFLFLCVVLCFLGGMFVSCQESDVTTIGSSSDKVIEIPNSGLSGTNVVEAYQSARSAEWYPLYRKYRTELEPDRSPLPSFEDL